MQDKADSGVHPLISCAHWSVILLALYYSACDVVLIYQVFYYRRLRRLYPERFLHETIAVESSNETDALLPAKPPAASTGSSYKTALAYLALTAGVVLVLAGIWFISGTNGGGARTPEKWDTTSQILGWTSAFLYLGSRIPQIVKNQETKCEGLSLLMFAFSVAGNVTYVAVSFMAPLLSFRKD